MAWIFGYGSLVWRPAFSYRERLPGYIRGFVRRFWQGSPDHRGTPEAPGRVVTLIERPDAICWGVAYRVAAADWQQVIGDLDIREQVGYRRVDVSVHFSGTATTSDHPAPVPAQVYIATSDNPDYLGPASMAALAAHVRTASGPSGHNRDYVIRLDQALTEMGARDEHVAELARLLADS